MYKIWFIGFLQRKETFTEIKQVMRLVRCLKATMPDYAVFQGKTNAQYFTRHTLTKNSKQNVTALLQLHSLKTTFLTFPQPDPGGRRGPEAQHGCPSCWGDAVWLCTRRWRPLKGLVHSENTQAHNTGRLSFSRAKAFCRNFPGNCCPPYWIEDCLLALGSFCIVYCGVISKAAENKQDGHAHIEIPAFF